MTFLFDFHCHLYAIYDLRKAILFAQRGPVKNSADAEHSIVLFLTERHDCKFFDALSEKKLDLGKRLEVTKIDSSCCKIGKNIYLVKGRQYATQEGIEVLSYFAAPQVPEKISAKSYCEEIIAAGGMIAFSWAFGKWRGNRAALIESLALEYGPHNVVLLDSRLRPAFMPLPKVFSRLETKEFKLFAGSDPLPLYSHQNKLASFACGFDNIEIKNSNINSESIRKIISGKNDWHLVGVRSGLIEFIKDQIALRA